VTGGGPRLIVGVGPIGPGRPRDVVDPWPPSGTPRVDGLERQFLPEGDVAHEVLGGPLARADRRGLAEVGVRELAKERVQLLLAGFERGERLGARRSEHQDASVPRDRAWLSSVTQ
jgi:hypothetical protein